MINLEEFNSKVIDFVKKMNQKDNKFNTKDDVIEQETIVIAGLRKEKKL
jgi:hypothetical protein